MYVLFLLFVRPAMFLLMEYVTSGDLMTYFKAQGSVGEDNMWFLYYNYENILSVQHIFT